MWESRVSAGLATESSCSCQWGPKLGPKPWAKAESFRERKNLFGQAEEDSQMVTDLLTPGGILYILYRHAGAPGTELTAVASAYKIIRNKQYS